MKVREDCMKAAPMGPDGFTTHVTDLNCPGFYDECKRRFNIKLWKQLSGQRMAAGQGPDNGPSPRGGPQKRN